MCVEKFNGLRIRSLPYAGKPPLDRLSDIAPREDRSAAQLCMADERGTILNREFPEPLFVEERQNSVAKPLLDSHFSPEMRVLGRDISGMSMNALYLMAATGVTALFGFSFWLVIARTHDTGTVGRATLLIAASTLISFTGLVGLDLGIVRFLPQSKNPSEYITSSLFVVSLVTLLLSLLFLFLVHLVSPQLAFITKDPIYIVYFTTITVFTTLNSFTSTLFIAYRRTSFILWINLIVGAFKLFLAINLRNGGAIAVFNITGMAQIANVLMSVLILAYVLDYRPSLKMDFRILLKTSRFTSASYLGDLFAILPGTLLPILVVIQLGTTKEAYFYIAFTIANLLLAIPGSVMQSFYAEASHKPEDLKILARKIISDLRWPIITRCNHSDPSLSFTTKGIRIRLRGRIHFSSTNTLRKLISNRLNLGGDCDF